MLVIVVVTQQVYGLLSALSLGIVGLMLVLTSSTPRRLGDHWADTVVVEG